MRFQEEEEVPWAKTHGTKKQNRNKNYSNINRSIQAKKHLRNENLKEHGFTEMDDDANRTIYETSYSKEISRFGWDDSEDTDVTKKSHSELKKKKYLNHENVNRFADSEKSYLFRGQKSQVREKTEKRIPGKSVGVYGKAAHIAKEIAQRIRRELTDALQQQQDEKGKNKGTGFKLLIGLPLIMIGIVVLLACIIITSIPAMILAFLISSNVETKIVEAAQQEYYIFDQNIGGQKYKDWYGLDGNWCAMFVSYCSEQCGYINDGFMPRTASVEVMASWYKDRDEFVYATTGYEPKPGDIIFFQEGMSHVGIVVDYDSETKMIYTIEGNTGASETEIYHEGSQVMLVWYPLTHARITGYGTPDYPIDFSLDREIVVYREDKKERRLCA